MNDIKVETTGTESYSTKREVIPKKEKPEIEDNPKKGNLSLKMKIILFGSIGLTIILIVGIVLIITLHSKSEKEYKMEISDLKTEKEVLENQNSKMKNEIQTLTASNTNLNKRLNNKLLKLKMMNKKRMKLIKLLKLYQKKEPH